jgi:uncharacterized protein (TIGR03663 family)
MTRPGRSSLAFIALLLLLTAGALLLRLPDLGNRPFHGDEAVHAVKFSELWQKGVYRYDANEFHGPTIYYAALPSVWLHGRHDFASTQESDYRLPIVVFGAALLLLFFPLADGMGRQSALWSALFTALSTAFVFYSRYYIQEMLLAFFTLGMIACGWRYVRSHRASWLLGAGVCAGLMAASKETAVLTFLSCGLALELTAWWTRLVDGRSLDLRRHWNGKFAVLAIVAGLLTACLFLSGFLTNLAGPFDYLRSYTPWITRAHGTNLHQHPWWYYLKILIWTHPAFRPVWSEGLIVGLAAVGLITALRPHRREKGRGKREKEGVEETNSQNSGVSSSLFPLPFSFSFARFMAFYTLLLTGTYSLIPYKTPWCVLSFLQGMIVLAGMGAVALIRAVPGKPLKAVLVLLLLTASAQLGWQAYRASYIRYADDTNPYCYAQPVPDAVNLGLKVEELARSHPQHEQMVVKVFSIDEYYWPVPWYLRRFPNVGYWTGQVPQDADAPVILASPEFDEELTKKLDATHLMNGYFGLRPGTFFEVWVRLDLWKTHLEDKKRARGNKPEEE